MQRVVYNKVIVFKCCIFGFIVCSKWKELVWANLSLPTGYIVWQKQTSIVEKQGHSESVKLCHWCAHMTSASYHWQTKDKTENVMLLCTILIGCVGNHGKSLFACAVRCRSPVSQVARYTVCEPEQIYRDHKDRLKGSNEQDPNVQELTRSNFIWSVIEDWILLFATPKPWCIQTCDNCYLSYNQWCKKYSIQ